MKRCILAVALLALSLGANAFQPRTGHWYNPAESGRGFNIDIQDGVMVLTMYSYDSSGNAQWYLASGNMTNGQRGFSAPLGKFRGGQCLECAYSGAPVSTGNDGAIFVNFATETSATVTLPGGHTSQIVPFNFKYGEPPNGMLGEWVFVEDIIITFADRFNFTTIIAGTAGGNGIAFDPIKNAGCELQTSGSLVGQVICVDTDGNGKVQNAYRFKYGLDETFQGFWVSFTTGAEYSMKGFRSKTVSGYTKSAVRSDAASKWAAETAAPAAPEGVFSQAVNAIAERLR